MLRAPKRPSLWKVPLFVAVLIVAVTGVFAMQQRHAIEERRNAAFDAVVGDLERSFSRAIGDRINEFSVATDYVTTRARIDEASFRSFLALRREGRASPIVDDPGLTVAEYVDDLAALEQRERANGRPEFTVFSLFPVAAGEHVVITHLEQEVEIAGRPLIGLDVTGFQAILEPDQLFERRGIRVDLAPIDQLLGGFTTTGTTPPDADAYEEAVIYLIAPWTSADGASRGVITRLDSINDVAAEVSAQLDTELALDVRLRASGQYIARFDNRSDATSQFMQQIALPGADGTPNPDLAELEITVTASNDFRSGPETTVALTWVIGAIVALFGGGLAMLRAHQARRLADTGVELEIAQAMASTDPLTGLLNRQGLVDAVEQPTRRGGTLVFIDLDNFKAVNDADGHAEGDRVLRRIGAELRQLVRADDIVCRLGGDEFLLFLPGSADDRRISDLRARIATAVHTTDPRITASIGWASRTADSEVPLDTLMNKADAAMYGDKRSKDNARR